MPDLFPPLRPIHSDFRNQNLYSEYVTSFLYRCAEPAAEKLSRCGMKSGGGRGQRVGSGCKWKRWSNAPVWSPSAPPKCAGQDYTSLSWRGLAEEWRPLNWSIRQDSPSHSIHRHFHPPFIVKSKEWWKGMNGIWWDKVLNLGQLLSAESLRCK